MRAVRISLCVTICLALCSTNVQAADKKTEAKLLFKRAQLAYKLGKFENALGEYSKAYEMLPLPGFLFNIGQCHRQLGAYERAVFFYKGYLREKPEAKNRALVGDLIQECLAKKKAKQEQARLEAERKRAQELKRRELASKAEKLRILEGERRLSEERAIEEAKARQMEAVMVAEAAQKREEALTPFYKTWWFWSLIGGAAAAIAGGTAYALTSGDTHVLPSGTLGTAVIRNCV